jgi:hypothetical protein
VSRACYIWCAQQILSPRKLDMKIQKKERWSVRGQEKIAHEIFLYKHDETRFGQTDMQ